MTDNRAIQQIESAIKHYEPAQSLDELSRRKSIEMVVGMALATVRRKSQRVYGQTYRSWVAWCDDNGVSPFDLNVPNVTLFLLDGKTTKTTRQNRLSHMRRLAQVLIPLDGEPARLNHDMLMLMKAPEHDDKIEATLAAEHERSKKALSPSEVDTILRAWPGSDLTSRRNTAMLAVMFTTGIRRSELVEMEWRNVDFENATIFIPHAKRGKSRHVTIIGGPDGFGVLALRAWQRAMQTAEPESERKFVFPSLAKGGKLGPDEPTWANTVYEVCQETSKRSGIEFSPHDARRTVITEWTRQGTIAGAQAQAGHTSEAMTLRYAQAVNAEKRHDETHGFRFGAVTAHDRKLFAELPIFENGDGAAKD